MIKVLFPIGTFFPSELGGPNNSVYWLVSELQRKFNKELKITVVTTDYGISKELKERYNIRCNEFSKINNVEIIYFNIDKHNKFSSRLMYWTLRNIDKFDVIFLTSFFNYHSLFIGLLSKFKNKKVIISPRGELEYNALKMGNKNFFIKKIILFFAKIIYKNYYFHVTSEQEERFCKAYFPLNKYFVIPNLMKLSKNFNSVKLSDKKGILFIGRLQEKKGLENLFKAYAMIKKDYKDKHFLLIAGKGKKKYEDKLKSLVKELNIEKYVKFLGYVEGKNKIDLYNKSLMMVLPSFSENFANVVIEAINNNTYVITSVFTPWEILKKKKAGSWIDNSPEALSKEIEKVIQMDDSTYNTFLLNAKKILQENFDIEKNIYKYKDMIIRVYNDK